jgi:hypothetical protein
MNIPIVYTCLSSESYLPARVLLVVLPPASISTTRSTTPCLYSPNHLPPASIRRTTSPPNLPSPNRMVYVHLPHSPFHQFTPLALPSPPSPPPPPPLPSLPSVPPVPGPTTAVAARWPRVTRRREYANSLSYHTYNLTIFPAHTIVLCASTIPDRSSLTKSELTRGRSSYLCNRLFS